jgi:polyisoprenoid-binding protein YceI
MAFGVRAGEVDPAHTEFGFTLKTRWGQVLRGRFPEFRGAIEPLADGRRRTRVVLLTRTVEIVGHPNYTGFTRGEGFFDARRHPEVSFVSEPYDDALVRKGGKLMGRLSIRGIERDESFVLAPTTCERAALDCDVVATGVVRRSDYGLDKWSFAVSDQVRFTLRLRVKDAVQ